MNNQNDVKTKKLKVDVTCMAVYSSIIEVPINLSLEEAIEYAKNNMDNINATELEWIGDIGINDEECYFDRNMEYYEMKELSNFENQEEKDKFLERLWEEFANTPVCEDTDCIDEDFYVWDKGTDKSEIWHWFDDNHSKGLAIGLMGFFE